MNETDQWDAEESLMHEYVSLRDWFAGQALAGPVASRVALYDAKEIARIGGPDWMARGAYNIAGAMLKAREERK